MSPEPEVLVSGRKTNKSALQICSNPSVHLPSQKMLGEAAVIQAQSPAFRPAAALPWLLLRKPNEKNRISLRNRVRTACDCIRDNAIFIPALALVCDLAVQTPVWSSKSTFSEGRITFPKSWLLGTRQTSYHPQQSH